MTEEQLRSLHAYRESPAFSPLERLVLEYAEEMCQVPVVIPDELFARLREHFDEEQIVELTTAIAIENFRARFNDALGITPAGFSSGEYCAVPDAVAAQEVGADLGVAGGRRLERRGQSAPAAGQRLGSGGGVVEQAERRRPGARQLSVARARRAQEAERLPASGSRSTAAAWRSLWECSTSTPSRDGRARPSSSARA